MRKKIINIGVVLSILSQISITPVIANTENNTVNIAEEDIDLTISELEENTTQNKELVEILQDAEEVDYDSYIVEFMEESDEPLLDNVIDYLEDNFDDEDDIDIIYDDNLVEEYSIDENHFITFTPTEIFVDSFFETTEEIVTDKEELEKFNQEDNDYVLNNIFLKFLKDTFSMPTVNAKGQTKRKQATHSRTYYAKLLGQKVVTVGIGVEFTYNGSKVTARTTQNYTKTHWGSLGVWQLKSKKNGIQKPSNKRRIAYQEATFAEGFTIKGNGLAFQTRYLRANIEGNHNGKITKSSVSR